MFAKHYKDKKVETVKKKFFDRKFDGNAFTTRMDPSSQATRYPVEYPIMAGSHRPMIDVKYHGPETDSDNVVAIASLNRNGPLYQSIDCVQHPIGINYLGLAITPANTEETPGAVVFNLEYNQQFRDMMLEALSAAYATQLTELAFLTSTYETDLPGLDTDDEIHRNGPIAALVFYQTVVQNMALVMSKYNTLLAFNDYLLKLGYNAEAQVTMAMLNLFKKATTFSVMEQVGEILSQEYLDLDWFREMCAVTTVPSRKYDDMLSPLVTILGVCKMPNLTINTDDFSTEAQYWRHIPVTVNDSTVYYSFESLIYHVLDLMDVNTILQTSRSYYFDTSSGTPTPVRYINDFLASMRALLGAYARFSRAMVDLKTFLMVLQDSTVLNKWVIGSTYTKPSRPRSQMEPVDYLLADDIVKATYSGGAELTIDMNTRKWDISTLWDYDEGISSFDYYEGGFAIANSVRNLPVRTSADAAVSPMYMFPIMFRQLEITYFTYDPDHPDQDPTTTNVVQNTTAFDRRGRRYSITREVMTSTMINNNYHLARLAIAGHNTGSIILPAIRCLDVVDSGDLNINIANMERFCLNFFGCLHTSTSRYIDSQTGNATNYPVSNVSVSPKVIGVVHRQFTDPPENAMNYLRCRVPLRQFSGDATIGFTMGR